MSRHPAQPRTQDARDLAGVNVVTDAYNLGLLQGTGIKTYSLTLIKALKVLQANVSVLFSGTTTPRPALNEVLLYDTGVHKNNPGKLALTRSMLKAIIPLLYKAQAATNDIVVRDGSIDTIDSVGILALEDCYRASHQAHTRFGVTTSIRVPGRMDIWHATTPLPIKVRGAKTITTFHDLIPLRLPYTTLDDKRSYYRLVSRALKESSAVITTSEHTKKDILHVFDINPDKIYVTYEAVNTVVPSKQRVLACLSRYHLKYKDYMLFVGAIEPKKNVGRLIDAYSLLRSATPLVIVGKRGWLWEGEIGKIESLFGSHFDRVIRLLDYVPSYDLQCLYAGAKLLVFPSLYEGFGLPPLEAMSLGCPVITSNVSALPEVCGDSALYVNPYDVFDIKDKMDQLLSDSQLQSQLAMSGIRRAEFFSLENYAHRLYQAYSRVL